MGSRHQRVHNQRGAVWHTRTSSAFTFCTRPAHTVCALAATRVGLRPGRVAPRVAGTRARLLSALLMRGSAHPRRVADILARLAIHCLGCTGRRKRSGQQGATSSVANRSPDALDGTTVSWLAHGTCRGVEESGRELSWWRQSPTRVLLLFRRRLTPPPRVLSRLLGACNRRVERQGLLLEQKHRRDVVGGARQRSGRSRHCARQQ